LRGVNPQAAEFPVAMNYVEFMLDIPWDEYTEDNFDLKRAKKILDADHFGLEKVKNRILEYLAVLKLKKDMKGPILCLYGPPGVGKTSLGKSIAKSLKRQYVRMSLGGLHDEAEIRGHRKTYIGAMPGKILLNIKKAKSSNPSLFSTRSIRFVPIFVAIRHRLYWKYWIPNKTARLATTTWRSIMTFRRCCLSRLQTHWIRFTGASRSYGDHRSNRIYCGGKSNR